MQRQKPSGCIGCECWPHGTDYSQVTGTGASGVMIVGEASGQMEAREQRPFVQYAPAGSVLERNLRRMGLSREQFSITNVLRCFPGNVVVEASNVRNAFRRWFRGELIWIYTDMGILSGTPNHPALTNNGWIPLGLLKEGDYLVRGPLPERMTGSYPNIYWDSSRFDNTFNALSYVRGRCRVIGSDVDFHGDGGNSYVDVVHMEGFLGDDFQLFSRQHVGQLPLESPNLERSFPQSVGACYGGTMRPLSRDFNSTCSSVSSSGDSRSSLHTGTLVPNTHCIASSSERNTYALESSASGLWADAELYRQSLQSFSSDISLCQIRKIKVRAFSGHVYNLHTKSEVYTANGFIVHNCRPKNNWLDGAPWEYSAIRQCRQYLDAAIAERRPRVIVALGGIALRELTGMAGESRGISHLAGYVLPLANTTRRVQHRCVDCDIKGDQPTPGCLLCGGTGWWDTDEPAATANAIPVLGNWHPSYLRHGKMSHCGNFVRIMQRAMNIAAGKDREWLWNVEPENRSTHGTLDYITRPSVGDARSYYLRLRDSSGATLAYDLETSESTSLDEDAREGFADTRIRLAQFCYESGHAIAMPHEDGFREVVRDILALPNVKCGHNIWLFDDKVLRAATGTVPAGVRHDTLQMFHHWQPDLPAHLQYAAQFVQFPFPWKHLAGTDLAFYGCCDVDATLRLYNFLEHKLKADDIWGDDIRGYVGQVYHVRPVLARMEERGVPIDDAARIRLGNEFEIAQRQLGAEIVARVPRECGRVQPKGGYKGVPPEVKKWTEEQGPVTGHIFTDSGEDGEQYQYECRKFAIPIIDATGNPTTGEVIRWCRIYQFNPNSGKQLIEYMKLKKHKVPKDKHKEDAEGNQKDTTAAKELQRLANRTGDDFYLKVIEYRGLTKMRGTYVDGFVPHADGCVHTTFTFDTGIGQLSSRNPNVQNFPKLKPTQQLADAMRAMIAAKDGYVISEWDYKSCHALTLGFLAESERYMRLARLDIHSFTAGHFLRCWDGNRILHESDEALMERFEWLKSDPERKRVRDDQAKHAILGIGNGLKAKGLYERYLESFPGPGGMKTAQKFLDILEKELFPEVFEWQRRMQNLAHDQQFLKTEFGHIRRFYEVFRWDGKKGCWSHGDQAEQAISFWLSNIAFGHIREGLKQLHRTGLAEKYGLINNVHDSYIFHFPAHMLDEHVAEVYPILIAPSTVLKHPRICPDGLVIGVEASAGPNWAPQNMKKLKLGVKEASCSTALATL